MIYKWFYIFNVGDFEDEGLVSQTFDLVFDGIGQKSVLVTQGNLLGITYEGVFLPLELNDKNPFEFDSHAIYVDANENVWLGLPIEDE